MLFPVILCRTTFSLSKSVVRASHLLCLYKVYLISFAVVDFAYFNGISFNLRARVISSENWETRELILIDF